MNGVKQLEYWLKWVKSVFGEVKDLEFIRIGEDDIEVRFQSYSGCDSYAFKYYNPPFCLVPADERHEYI